MKTKTTLITVFILMPMFTYPATVLGNECTGAQIEKMIDKGFTKQEINEYCNAGPSIDISGKWLFIQESPYGNVREDWKIALSDGQLTIHAWRQNNLRYSWVPLNITSQRIKGDHITFSVKEDVHSSTRYDLQVQGDDRITGSFKTTDSFVADMGGGSASALISIPTEFGEPDTYSGPVRLLRQ